MAGLNKEAIILEAYICHRMKHTLRSTAVPLFGGSIMRNNIITTVIQASLRKQKHLPRWEHYITIIGALQVAVPFPSLFRALIFCTVSFL